MKTLGLKEHTLKPGHMTNSQMIRGQQQRSISVTST